MRILAKIALALTLFETKTAFSYQGTSQDTWKILSHIYRGASLWNFVNCNDKEASLAQNFNVCMYVCMYECQYSASFIVVVCCVTSGAIYTAKNKTHLK